MQHHFIISEFFQAYDKLTPTHIDGNLGLRWPKISSLGNLTYVDGWLEIRGTKIRSLGNIEHVPTIYCDPGIQYRKLIAENNGRFTISV